MCQGRGGKLPGNSFCSHGRGRVAPNESESVEVLSSPIHIGLESNRSCRMCHDGTWPKQYPPPPPEPKGKTKAVEINMGELIVLLTLSF